MKYQQPQRNHLQYGLHMQIMSVSKTFRRWTVVRMKKSEFQIHLTVCREMSYQYSAVLIEQDKFIRERGR
jgi:hypothetical protein